MDVNSLNMDEIKSLLEYFKSLIDCLYHQYFSMHVTDDITTFIYEYMLDDNKDFSEFSKDCFNCGEYEEIDKKDIFQKIMFAVYFMMKFYYDEVEELCEFNILESYNDAQLENNLDDLFKMEEFGLEIVNEFLLYFDFSAARKKKMALKLINNSEFLDLSFNNNYIKMLLNNDLGLNIPEVAALVDEIAEIYNSVNLNSNFDEKNYKSINEAADDIKTDYQSFDKVKRKLVVYSLNNKNGIIQSQKQMKHWFSVMLKSNYINIYKKRQNSINELSILDTKFFEMISKNEGTLDDLFYQFMHDKNFSAYLLGSFYFDNIDKELIDYENDEELCQEKQIDEKIKKYCI